MIQLKTYSLKDITLSNEVLSINIDKFWTDITIAEWENLKKNHGKKMWSFQEESIKEVILV
jgi:hypothetical protein